MCEEHSAINQVQFLFWLLERLYEMGLTKRRRNSVWFCNISDCNMKDSETGPVNRCY